MAKWRVLFAEVALQGKTPLWRTLTTPPGLLARLLRCAALAAATNIKRRPLAKVLLLLLALAPSPRAWQRPRTSAQATGPWEHQTAQRHNSERSTSQGGRERGREGEEMQVQRGMGRGGRVRVRVWRGE